MKNMILGTLVTALTLSAATAFAAPKEGSFSLSPMVGGYIYDNDQQFNANLVLGVRAGYGITKAVGVEALYDYVTPTDSKYLAIQDITLHRFGAQVLYHFTPDGQLAPYLAAGVSGVLFQGRTVNNQIHSAFDYGAGAKYFLSDNIAVRADLRHILYSYNSATFNNVEFTLGALFQFGGVTPAVKAVAAAPALASALVKDATGPATRLAANNVAVATTEAPEKLAAIKVAAIAVEAPEPIQTVNQPAPAVVHAAAKSLTAGPVPVALSLPELTAAGAGESAAPLRQACALPADTTVLFPYERTDIKSNDFEEVDRIGNFLRSYPGAKVTIEGHTSAMGSRDANQKLSRARAENIKSHLIYKFGIDASRITAIGYGLTKPVASNKTTSGRARNRRIVAVFSCE